MGEIGNLDDRSSTGKNNKVEALLVKPILIRKVDLSNLLHGNSPRIKRWEIDWHKKLDVIADPNIVLFNQCIKPRGGKFMPYQEETIERGRPEEAWSETLMTVISFALRNAMSDSERISSGPTATQIGISSHIAKDTLIIEVKDNGQGIPKETAAKLSPGYMLKEAGNEVGNRLRSIGEAVGQIGGRVEMVTKRIEDLKPGETSGTTVRFTFPVNTP